MRTKKKIYMVLLLITFLTGCSKRPFNTDFKREAFEGNLTIDIHAEGVDSFNGVKEGSIFQVKISSKSEDFYRIEFWDYGYRLPDKKVKVVELSGKKDITFKIPGDHGDLGNWNPISKIECFSIKGSKITQETILFPSIRHSK